MASTLDSPTDPKSINLDEGPPPATKKPKKSLFSQAGSDLQTESQQGLGPEGGSAPIMAQKALQGILSNVQVLSTVLPGIVPVLSDLTGRLQMIVPQLMADLQAGGMGLVPQGGMPPQGPMAPAQMGPPPQMGGPSMPPQPGQGGPPMMPPPQM